MLCETRRPTERSQKKSRNVRRRIKQKADAENKAAAEEEAAEWRSTRSKPDFGDCDKKKKPQVTLPLRGAASSKFFTRSLAENGIFNQCKAISLASSRIINPYHRRLPIEESVSSSLGIARSPWCSWLSRGSHITKYDYCYSRYPKAASSSLAGDNLFFSFLRVHAYVRTCQVIFFGIVLDNVSQAPQVASSQGKN
jgi:hypothetical protein